MTQMRVQLEGHGGSGPNPIRAGDVIVSITHARGHPEGTISWDCHMFDGLTVVESHEGFGGMGLTCALPGKRGRTKTDYFGSGWAVIVERA